MRLRWNMRQTWWVALAALQTLVLAVAPLAAQSVMAGKQRTRRPAQWKGSMEETRLWNAECRQ